MNKLVLKSNEPTEENILAIINYVRALERENGLSDEEISYKYTHGDCTCLTTLINYFLPKVKVYLFEKEMESSHYCVGIRGDIVKDSKLAISYEMEGRRERGCKYYYDINGRKYFEEMCSFIESEYYSSPISGFTFKQDPTYNNNDITNMAKKI